ncbi:hypothetical protein GCM10009578_068380 [Streptomyces rhizosphaericus]
MRSTGRTRRGLGLTVSALLTTSLAAALLTDPTAAGASSAAVTDYSITVDPDRAGPEIDDAMYGAFYEDINRAADGGLYAELVQNRSFGVRHRRQRLVHPAHLVDRDRDRRRHRHRARGERRGAAQ